MIASVFGPVPPSKSPLSTQITYLLIVLIVTFGLGELLRGKTKNQQLVGFLAVLLLNALITLAFHYYL